MQRTVIDYIRVLDNIKKLVNVSLLKKKVALQETKDFHENITHGISSFFLSVKFLLYI